MGEITFMGIKFDNHVSVGHIFTTVAAVCAGIFAFANTQNDIKNLQQANARIEHRQDSLDIRSDQQQQRSDAQYEKMQTKIDKIYEVVVSRNK